MPQPPIWPPPPNTPEPLSAHDAFLIAAVRNSTLKPPLSRLSLVKDLRDGTGLDLRSCLATVNNFCDRYGIFTPASRPAAFAGCLSPVVILVTLAAMNMTWYILQQRHDAAATHMERVMITAERIRLDFVFIGIILVATSISLIVIFRRIRQTRDDAAEARAKFV
jgi:hypothetical protein